MYFLAIYSGKNMVYSHHKNISVCCDWQNKQYSIFTILGIIKLSKSPECRRVRAETILFYYRYTVSILNRRAWKIQTARDRVFLPYKLRTRHGYCVSPLQVILCMYRRQTNFAINHETSRFEIKTHNLIVFPLERVQFIDLLY